LLMGEGALADIVLLTPTSAYNKAWEIAKGRGEAVDPSHSGRRGMSVGQPSWEDRAASTLLRYLLGKAVNEDLLFRRVEGGFEVFRAYGGVEVRVDVTRIGESAARSKAASEELRRLVKEAKEMAPALSGMDKAPQYLEWRATDVSTTGKQIEAATTHPWQLSWYFGLLGEPKSFSGGANVTKEGTKPAVTARWPREREDQILRESRWLESLLNQQVESWRQLVDAIDWRHVLKRVEELADELKPWIDREDASNAEREGLARRMLGELALLAHFAGVRRKMDDGRWREERAKRLAKAVEALSGGRIAGEYADRLAELIISYAESREEKAKKRIDKLAEKLAGVPREEVWSIVEFVLGDMYCLARDCADDRIVRKFVAPALELVMLDKALSGKFSREEALLRFGEMYATAIAGDGSVEPGKVGLIVGGELGGGAALLRLATLHLLKQLLPDELKFGVRIYIRNGRNYYITATGEDAARLKCLLAVSAPSAGGKYLSEKFHKFVEVARVEVRLGDIWLTEKGRVAADLTLSVGDAAVKYNVYLRGDAIELELHSTDRSRVELAARLLRLAGVSAEVKKQVSMDLWRVVATTDKLAAGREELRKALAEIVETARGKGWVDAGKAERWLEKLEKGRVLREGWPKYHVGLSGGSALVVRYETTNPDSIQQVARRLNEIGLMEGIHFTMKMPEGDRDGYVSILREGLAHAAWLSVHGEGEQRELAADFVEYILQRAREEGDAVYEKAKEIVKEGKERGSLRLEGFEGRVEVGGSEYVVKVTGWGAEIEKKQNGKKLLRLKITAEVGRVEGEHTIVDRVVREYTITFGRYGNNAARGHAYASAKAPGGRVADAERFAAVVKALTGEEPWMYQRSDGKIMMECYERHLKGFARYAELGGTIKKWLDETGR